MDVIADPGRAIAELRRRGLPDVFERLWASQGLGFGRPPKPYFRMAADLAALIPGAAGLCPLWEVNGEAVVGQLPSGAFVRIYYEDAGKGARAIEYLAGDYIGFVEWVLTGIADAGTWDWFDRVASALAYPDPGAIRAKLSADA